MSGTRGVSLAVLVLSLSLGMGVMADLGIGEDAGVQLSGSLDDERRQAQDDYKSVESQGGSGDSFSSQAVGGTQTLNALRIMIVHTSAALQANGVPRPIADAAQFVMDLSFVLALLYAVIRVKP